MRGLFSSKLHLSPGTSEDSFSEKFDDLTFFVRLSKGLSGDLAGVLVLMTSLMGVHVLQLMLGLEDSSSEDLHEIGLLDVVLVLEVDISVEEEIKLFLRDFLLQLEPL